MRPRGEFMRRCLVVAVVLHLPALADAQDQAPPPDSVCAGPEETRPPDPRCQEPISGRPAAPPTLVAPRLLLQPPRLISRALFWPFIEAGDVIEHYRLAWWLDAILTTDDGRVGVRPELHYSSGFLPTAGLRAFNRWLPGAGSELSGRFLTAGPSALISEVTLVGPQWSGLTWRATWHRRKDRLFAGTGPLTGAELQAQGRGAARFGSDILLTELRWLRQLPAGLSVGLRTDVQRRDYQATSVSSGPSVAALYGLPPETCASLNRPAGCLDPAWLPRFDEGLRLVHVGALAGLDLRRDARDAGGVSVTLQGSHAQGIAGDPSQHLTLGAESVAAIPGLDKVLLLRLRGETIERLGTAPIPFDELVTPSGPDGMRGFPTGRFRGPSGLVGSAEYRWFVAYNLDAALFCDLGTVAGPRFEGLDMSQLFPSFGLGARWYNPEAEHWRAPLQNGVQIAYAADAGFRVMLSVAGF